MNKFLLKVIAFVDMCKLYLENGTNCGLGETNWVTGEEPGT